MKNQNVVIRLSFGLSKQKNSGWQQRREDNELRRARQASDSELQGYGNRDRAASVTDNLSCVFGTLMISHIHGPRSHIYGGGSW
jgi:hypothetical protein